jgi:hypothetical protein
MGSPAIIDRFRVDDARTETIQNWQRLSPRGTYAFLSPILTLGIAAHLDRVGVVDQPVENIDVARRGIAELFVPAGNWQMRSQDVAHRLVTRRLTEANRGFAPPIAWSAHRLCSPACCAGRSLLVD